MAHLWYWKVYISGGGVGSTFLYKSKKHFAGKSCLTKTKISPMPISSQVRLAQ